MGLSQDGLDFELKEKFGRKTFNLFELTKRATRYESIVREENHKGNALCDTYYQDRNYENYLGEFFRLEAIYVRDSSKKNSSSLRVKSTNISV